MIMFCGFPVSVMTLPMLALVGEGEEKRRRRQAHLGLVGGKTIRRQSADWTEADAKREEAKARLGHQVKEPQAKEEPRQQASITLSQGVDRYLKLKARKRSLRRDREMLVGRLSGHFGADSPFADSTFTAGRISEFRESMLGATSRFGRVFSPATINRHLAVLSHLLHVACDEWMILIKVPKIRMESVDQRIRWLEPDQEARLLDACRRSTDRDLVLVVTIAMETGMRKGEILGLTWDRVDLSRGVIRLELTKGGRRREVPMRQVVYDILAALPGPREGRVFHGGGLRRVFETAVTRAGLEDFHFHDLRHHFGSWFLMRGGHLEELRQILGHATLKMTLRYAHLSPAHLRTAMLQTERQLHIHCTNRPAAAAEVPVITT
jgi:integrase